MPAIVIPIIWGLGELIVAGLAAIATVVVIATAVEIVEIVDDYLDERARKKEYIDSVRDRVGDKSKAEQRRLKDCKQCKWCGIIIQAQGVLVGGMGGSTESLGPYVIQGRTVFANEGIIVLGATHLKIEGVVGRKNLKEIERLGVFAKTAKYILERPPHGLQPGRMDYRADSGFAVNRQFRYDIGVMGTIPAFLS